MQLFEEGVKLTDSLRKHLDTAEQRISTLVKGVEGELKMKKSDE